jgi:hypothetical protein
MELALWALVSAFGVGETDRLRSDGARLTDAAADELAVALLRQTTEVSEAPAGSAP